MPQKFSVQPEPPAALSKAQVALHQLDRAMRLLLHEGDAVSAITLAGAAEEILGKLLDRKGEVPALRDFVDLCVMVGQYDRGDVDARKEFVSIANHFRDRLKHISDGEDIEVPPEAAVEMIDRAISNACRLGFPMSDLMVKFEEVWHT